MKMRNYDINQNNNSNQESRPKKNKKGIIIASIAIVCLIGIFSGSNDTASTVENANVETQEVTLEKDKMFTNEEDFINFIKSDVPNHIWGEAECTSVIIDNKRMLINLSTDDYIMVMESFMQITNSILAIEEGYEYWESITVDCGDYGSITKTKNDILTDMNGVSYFDMDIAYDVDYKFDSEEDFIQLIRHDAPHTIRQIDECTSVTINDKQILICISLGDSDSTFIPLSNNFSSITDFILNIEEGYEYWESITVDCGDYGSITKTKNDIVDNEYGMPYFNLTDEEFSK